MLSKLLVQPDLYANHANLYPKLYLLLTLHCIIGIGAAIVARQKGLAFKRWLVWGLVGGTAALIMAILTPKKAT